MPRTRAKKKRATAQDKTLEERYPPSEPCSCEVCLAYCARPGWWTVEQATRAIQAGYAGRMMLEMSPELNFGVLSPAFKGCESKFCDYAFMSRGCTFLKDNLCELYGTGLQPLECRFCHHTRRGLGKKCHADIEYDWNTPLGVSLVVQWSKQTGFWDKVVARTRPRL